MEVPRSIEVKVGFMIGAALALFMVSTLLLGGSKKFFTSTYTLKVRFSSVAGVAPGSVVQLLGVPVGNVKTIFFVPNTTELEVSMEIDKQFQPRITQGSVAGVRTQGALGDKYIYITPGPDSGAPMSEGDVMITEEGGDFFSTLAKQGENLGKVFSAVEELEKLLANLNANGKSAQLMPNLVKSADEMQKTMGNLNLLIGDLRSSDGGSLKGTLTSLDSVLKKIDKGQGTLGALINDPEIHERLKSALGGSTHNSFMKNQVRETIKSQR